MTQEKVTKAVVAKLDRAVARLARLSSKGKWADLETESEQVLASLGEDPHLRFFRAIAAYGQFRLGEAAVMAEAALAELPKAREITEFLAVIYALAGDLNTSAYYAKLGNTAEPALKLAGALPADFSKFDQAFLNIQERRLAWLGSQKLSAGQSSEAEILFREHLHFAPDDVQAATGMATSLILQSEWLPAIEALRGFRHRFPRDGIIAAMLANALEHWGRPLEAEACYQAATQLVPDNASVAAAWLNAPQAHPKPLDMALRAWASRFGEVDTVAEVPVPDAKDRQTVLWILGTQWSAAEREAFAHALAAFDPTRTWMVGAGPLPLSHAYNAPFQAAFDNWIDISSMDLLTLRMVLGAQQADVIMDVAGMTSPDTVLALATRLAPVQLAWPSLPYPPHDGYTGRISDHWLENAVAADGLRPYLLEHGTSFIERPASSEATAMERSDDRICFGADAGFLHLHPRQVLLWAEILAAIPEAALLLLDHGFQISSNARRLLEIFGDHGLGDRVDVFSASSQSFVNQIDVLLQPAPRGSLDTAIQALAAGVPVVEAAEPHRSNNQVHSLLHHLGLADTCVAADGADYVAKAIAWAKDGPRRQAFAATAAAALDNPVFDARSRGADLQTLITKAWSDAVDQVEA